MTDTANERGFQIGGLGEIAIRCADVGKMEAFYAEILGLERLSGQASDGIVFFRIADGVAGHTQILALFANTYETRPGLHPTSSSAPATGGGSSLHHIAFGMTFEAQEAAIRWYEAKGLTYRVERFGWIGWRGVFTSDPEGNTVELVAYHPSMKD